MCFWLTKGLPRYKVDGIMLSFLAGIAQLVEQLTCNQKVPSSTLGAGTNQTARLFMQSGCFVVTGCVEGAKYGLGAGFGKTLTYIIMGAFLFE